MIVKGRECRTHATRRMVWAVLLALLLGLTATLLVSHAESPDIDEIESAIAEQGFDWTTRVYTETWGLGVLPEEVPAEEAVVEQPSDIDGLPTSIDWRARGGSFVSPIKNQSSCGSCWAFASTAALESAYAIARNSPDEYLDLAEQLLVSCDSNSMGCNGGYMVSAARFLRDYGSYLEPCFPYRAQDVPCSGACSEWRQRSIRSTGYAGVAHSASAIKAALQSGPVVTCFRVYGDFDSYGGGVYQYATGPFRGYHAVLTVGYVDTPGQYGGGYFIVKNSWSTWWGESGYFRVGYSHVTNGVSFGYESLRYWITPVAGAEDAYEQDDSAGAARAAVLGATQTRSIFKGYDQDWVRLSLDRAYGLVVETAGASPGDTALTIYNSSLNPVATDDDSGVGYYSRVASDLGPGTFYVRATGRYPGLVLSQYKLTVDAFRFLTPDRWYAGFGSQAGGWTSQDAYPRLVGDVNGDGREDVVGFGQNAVSVALSTGSGLSTHQTWLERSFCAASGWTSQDRYPRFLADVNGDNRDDIVGCGQRAVLVSLSNGSSFGAPQTWLSGSLCAVKGWTSQNRFPRMMGDVNGDGKADLVGIGNSAVCVAPAAPTDDRFLDQQIWLRGNLCTVKGWSSQDRYPRLLGDVDGDGREDLVGLGQSAVCVTRSNGSGFGDQEVWHSRGFCGVTGWSSWNTYPRLLGDINGDGKADLVGFGQDAIYGTFSTGSAFGERSAWQKTFCVSRGYASQDAFPRTLANINGGTKDEIVGFGVSGVYVSPSSY